MKKIIYSMALVAGLSAISVGCSSEEQNLTQEMQATTTVEGGKIQFTLPKAFSSVQTYAIGGTADENAIVSSKVHALVFDALGTTLKGIFNQSSSNLTESSGVYTIDLNQEGDFKVMLLANLDLNTLNTPISVGDTYSTVIDKITTQDAVKTSGSFVMTSGPLVLVNVDGTTGANMNTVHLERLAARFDFRNLVQGLQITQVKFKNRFKHSKLAASSANLANSSKEDKTYTSSDFSGKPQTALFSVIYGYENVDSNATEFVLSGTYKNQPIEDVTVKLEKAVKRNHRYLINISESGSLDPNPTPTPPGTSPKLKFNIEVLDWNQGEKLKLDSSKLTINKPSKLEAPAVAIPGVTYNLLANPATATVEHNITQVTLSVVGNTGVTFVADVNNNTGAYTPNLVSTEFTEAGEVKQTWEINFAANTTPAQVINKWKIKHQIDNSEVEFKLTHKGKPAGGLLTNKLSNSPIMKLSEYAVNTAGTGFVNNHDINNNQVGYFTWTQATGNSISISGYTLPTKEQWFTILPNYYEGNTYRVYYGSNNIYNNQNETNSLGTFQADYRNKSSEKTTYAVRFKNDAELKSAWRYKYIPGQALVIDIIPLNNTLSNKTITDVEQASFWANNAGSIVKTITLPLYGWKNSSVVSSLGQIVWFWSASPYGGGSGWCAHMDIGSACSYIYSVPYGFPIFLIQN